MTNSHRYFLYIAASIFMLLAFLWYKHSFTNSEPPLLKADHTPKRIKPDNLDDTIVGDDHRNIYETLKNSSKTSQEFTKKANLLPEPETPITISSLQKPTEQEDAIDSIISGIVDGEEKHPEPIENNPNKALNIVTITDDKTTKNEVAHSTKKEYYIQVASTRSKDQANKEWIRISKMQSKIFSGLGHKIVKYELEKSGIFYQLLVGPISNASHTKLLCKKLVNAKLNCVIKRM